MDFQHLSNVHAPWNTEWIEDYVNGRPVLEIRHVLDRNHLGNDTFVSMSTSHLVAGGNLAPLCHRHPHHGVDASREIGVVGAGEDLHVHNFAAPWPRLFTSPASIAGPNNSSVANF